MSGTVTTSSGWQAVDSDADEVARYLELAAPLLEKMKLKSIDLLELQPGASVLDVGCGLGRDAEAVLGIVGSTGRVIGVDTGKALIEKATERTHANLPQLEFRVGNALALEFPDNTFDACRIDRVLQHLQDPGRAVAEMVRVTRPGGRVSVLEPDWYTLIISGGDVAVAQAVSRQLAFVSASQGDIGRRLIQLLMEVGCSDVAVDADVLLLRDLSTANFVLHIRATLEAAIAAGAVTEGNGDLWWKAVQELDAGGRFFASVNGVLCGGTVP